MKFKNIVNQDIVTLTNCDHELIHIPGSIQPHGFLLGLLSDWKIDYCTANISELIKVDHEKILGKTFEQIFGLTAYKKLFNYIKDNDFESMPFPLQITLNGNSYQVAIHKSDFVYVLEIEPLLLDTRQLASIYLKTIQFVTDMNNTTTLKQLCSLVAKGTREITGYDRVMIYRFDKDFNGEVFAENCREDLEPFVGLHYPHTDIPAQARELYLKNQLRMIVDINYTAVPIFTVDDKENKNLDLSHSILRSTSPIHVQYLKNMGVGATLTISLVHHGQLWGMIACHHYSPKNLSPEMRLSAKLQGQFITSQIDLRQSNDEYEVARKTNISFEKLTALNLPLIYDSFKIIITNTELLKLCNASGVSITVNHKIYKSGLTPSDKSINCIVSKVELFAHEQVFFTNRLKDYMPDLDIYKDISGIIYHSFGNGNNIIWYRPENISEINWAGDPNKAIILNSKGLHPRNSFDLWRQTIQFQSKIWLQPEINAAANYAHALRNKIILILLSEEEEKYRRLNEVLNETNSELENINWISTHDFQEPLRKIQLFASKALLDYGKKPPAVIIDSLQRITKSASRMQILLLDILKYSQIKYTNEKLYKISLNYVMEEILDDFKEIIKENGAVINCENLPEIHGVSFLIKQLFSNILHNSIKYASAERKPLIIVTASTEPEINLYSNKVYCHWVKFADNGIGFEQQYSESIFKIFTRLHAHGKYDGSGVGLALCKKIMETCNGNIIALGKSNIGTEITIYFPCDPLDSLIAKN